MVPKKELLWSPWVGSRALDSKGCIKRTRVLGFRV